MSLVAQAPGRDSVDARKRAQRAQTRFEQVRRYNLPRGFTSAGQACDARIGRFCQWNEDDPNPPKEPNPIREAREVLIRALAAEAGAFHPATTGLLASGFATCSRRATIPQQ
jgi:hypothetical protein